MKLALTLAAGLLAASSMAFAADNNGGKNDGKNDPTTTGSTAKDGINKDGTSDDAMKCREGTGGGSLCQEKGTTMQQ